MNIFLKDMLARLNIFTHRGPFIAMNIRQIDNALYYSGMYQKIKGVEGSIVECGVGKGRSFLFFNYLAQKEGKKRTIWGFDSFDGFPEPTTHDISPRNPKKGEWSGFSPETMYAILLSAGFSQKWIYSQVHLVKGFFADTLDQYTDGPIALLHIDSDLYVSYKEPLEVLFPMVARGGLVLFDEYKRPNWPGATKAVDDYFKDTSFTIQYDFQFDKYFIIK